MTDGLFDFAEPPTTCPHCGRRLDQGRCPWCDTPTPVKHLHRRNNPATSKAAAHSISASDLEAMVWTAIEIAGPDGMTADELLDMFPAYSYSSITARPAALKRKGLVLDSGRKRAGKSGRAQTVLVASKHLTLENDDRPSNPRPVPTDAPAHSVCRYCGYANGDHADYCSEWPVHTCHPSGLTYDDTCAACRGEREITCDTPGCANLVTRIIDAGLCTPCADEIDE